MNIFEFAQQPLKPLLRISPSRYLSLQQCPLKEIWASSSKPLLPRSPSAYLGITIHKMLQLAFQNRINSDKEFADAWDREIGRIEKEMLSNQIEKHLVPLDVYAYNYSVKKLLAFKAIIPLFGNHQKKNTDSKSSAETYVTTSDGKVTGIIDLIQESNDGIDIIDYKTGSILDKYSSDKPKDEYVLQIKIYAALYHDMHGEWPMKLMLIGINSEHFSIDVDSTECSNLLIQVKRTLDNINEQIEAGLQPEEFAQPSPEACLYCLYRPSCNKYWENRQESRNWPNDTKGRIKEIVTLANGFRIVIDSDNGDTTIRGLSPKRHCFLNDEPTYVIFCNLGHDTSGGFYTESMLTTGYALK